MKTYKIYKECRIKWSMLKPDGKVLIEIQSDKKRELLEVDPDQIEKLEEL